jgi:hypothetical protein
MEDKTHPKERKRGSWGRRIIIALAVICVLLIALYFIGTSSAFLKSVILPRAGKAINATITVDSASISPFSKVELTKLSVKTTGSEPLLTADQVVLRYSLMDIIKGDIHVDEATVVSPVVQIIQEPDGSSNLDPLLKKNETKKGEEKPSSSQPPHLEISNVALKNGVVRQITKLKGGGTKTVEVQNLNLAVDHLGNGQSGKLTISGGFGMEAPEGGTNNVLRGELNGSYDLALNPQLMPSSARGSTDLKITSAEGSYAQANGITASLQADLTPQDLREAALKFSKGGGLLGQVRVSGPLDLAKKEGNLKLEILSLDKNILNLAGAASGMDFRNSRFDSTNQIVISSNATVFALSGNLTGKQVSISRANLTTPEINLGVTYQTSVNVSDKSAGLEQLNISAEREGAQFLRTFLDQPMNLSWGNSVKGYKDASLQLILTNFNLADWGPVIGTNLSSGVVSSHLALASRQDGKQLNAELSTRISDLSVRFGTNSLQNAGLTLDASSTVQDLKKISIPKYSLALLQNNSPVFQASGSAQYSLDSKELAARITGAGPLQKLLALVPVPQAKAGSGNLKLDASYTDSGSKKKASGTLGLESFTGAYGAYQFQDFGAGVEYEVTMSSNLLEIARAAVSFKQGSQNGGSANLSGQYDLDHKSGHFNFQTSDLNENTLRPILAPSLGENQLVSISVNASGEAALAPEAETSIKADVKVDKWLVRDKDGKLPKTPLGVELALDGGMRQQVVSLRRLALQLAPTERAKNLLEVTGTLDLSKTNATPSKLNLASESFDLTPYYDLFAGGAATNKPAESSTQNGAAPAVAANAGQSEPAAMNLPFQDLTAGLKIDRLYLRQVAISNWVGTVAIHSNIVSIKPFQLNLNGGDVNLAGEFNLGTPGYNYDLNFTAQAVPLAPLADSFKTNSAGKLQGNFFAQAKVKGAGVTGPNLKKNLNGNATLNLTNLNYQIVGPKLKKILVPISVVLNAPELVATPVNWVSAQTTIGEGQIKLDHLGVESEAFYAESSGVIALADVLTNSTLNLPLDLSIAKSLAQKARLPSTSTTPDGRYVKLPRFVTVTGTLGDPKSDINKTALFGAALKEAAALGLGNAKTESILGGLGNVLTGQNGNTNNASTNASPAAKLLQGLGGLFGGKEPASTNNVKTNSPPANQPAINPFDLLRGLKNRK